MPLKTRRKVAAPTTQSAIEEALRRKHSLRGLVLDKPDKSHNSWATSVGMPSPTTASSPASTSQPNKISILDLPSETKKDIFRHATKIDLIALSLVCQSFREIAAEYLYRDFHVIFRDADDIASTDSYFDRLAAGLDTIVTSEYDYGRHLREIVFEASSREVKGERAYRHYLYGVSCGKFMNTLLLLTLRKSKALETFKWDIRVELSRPVFRALHHNQTLQHLHLRMQVGQSIYEAPPALSFNGEAVPSVNIPSTVHGSSMLSLPSGHISETGAGLDQKANKALTLIPAVKTKSRTLSGFKKLRTLAVLDMDSHEYIEELSACVRDNSSTLNSITLSFSEALAARSRKPLPEAVHSDDDTDEEDEFGIPSLGLPPISDDFLYSQNKTAALEEKKKQEAVLGKIFDVELAVAPTKATNPKEVTKEAKVDEDPRRRFIRNLAPVAAKLMAHVKAGTDLTSAGKETLAMIEKAAQMYLDNNDKSNNKSGAIPSIGSSTAKTTPAWSVQADLDTPTVEVSESKGLFDEPSQKITPSSAEMGVMDPDDIDVNEPESKELILEDVIDVEDTTSEVEGLVEDASTSFPDVKEQTGEQAEALSSSPPPTLFAEAADTLSQKVSDSSTVPVPSAAVIDAYLTALSLSTFESRLFEGVNFWNVHLVTSLNTEIAELVNEKILIQKEEKSLENNVTISDSEIEAARSLYLTQNHEITKRMDEIHDVIHQAHKSLSRQDKGLIYRIGEIAVTDPAIAQTRIHSVDVNPSSIEMLHAGAAAKRKEDRAKIKKTNMHDYIRKTRGLTLESLSIYLIPLKGTVLSRAIDLSVLQSITLLNVGAQGPFWNLLAKENRMRPVPLHKIYTDNVTQPFLTLVSQLRTLTELFLWERSTKSRPEITAVKTSILIQQIRNDILTKHVSSLKKLMIKNDASLDWDLNGQVVKLLCQRAKNLEELAISFDTGNMHTLLQLLPGLSSLRALHIIKFNTGDTCLWAMTESLRFIGDVASQHPGMKLEYVAVDHRVSKLIRRAPLPRKYRNDKGKGREVLPDKHLVDLILGDNSDDWNSGFLGGSSVSGEIRDEWDESEYEENEGDLPTLEVEIREGMVPSDIRGVRIFESDIIHGRL